jgi:hypothetical protein
LLCITWKQIVVDVGVGTNQKFDTYWAWMKELFDAQNKSRHEQKDRSLYSRWGVIYSECQKWSAMLLGDEGWYVSNVSIIFDAPCLFLHHLLLELCPRGNNKDVIIIILVHDNVYIPC